MARRRCVLAAGLIVLAAALPGPAAAAPAAALPVDSTTRRDAAALLPKFRQVTSEHFVLLSDAGRSWTRKQARVLERTYDEFQRFAAVIGARPAPLKHRLVCVLFSEREQFAAFALNDNVSASWSVGYYSLPCDRTVLFDGTSELGADPFAAARTVATTVHEAIHQLHYHTGVLNRRVQYPLWCSEGLATAFETDDPTSEFGPDRGTGPRHRRFLRLVREGGLLPLRELVALETVPGGRADAAMTIYSESCGLVRWLARHRIRELGQYLQSMSAERPGRPGAARHVALFEVAFGDLSTLEATWLRDSANDARMDDR